MRTEMPRLDRSAWGGDADARLAVASLWWMVTMAVACLLVLSGSVRGATIYVDSRLGSDRYDGQSPETTSRETGPVRTLQRAVALAQASDTIELKNNGTPYFGDVSLVGARHSGNSSYPFRIHGNGSIISGAKPVPRNEWRLIGPNSEKMTVWRITPFRKGHYQLILDGQAAPETDCPRDAETLPALEENHWCAWRGAVYVALPPSVDPGNRNFALADCEVGLTLLDVHDVIIKDLTLRHFRLDGVNAHDRCRDVLLDGLVCEQNGRAGLTVAGTSRILVMNTKAADNREASLLITELGQAELDACDLDQPPTVVGNESH
ncbi:MAG: hypothetical protein DWQ34_26855 [Planctomycetota bacterium]|nr:MAG: hypothetical protein DWQ34_26855 [Planctomycetota bacterium]REJ92284.1 MAG: hypothetical protein DWQ29_04970 [Planctomycetota bacterium]REK28483.1 MAG: hypothetical protein DWQ41_05910 [Planctomycetota bacterium]REK29097.1 MAG: hypothetical protein DWQ45_23420 [Planctomycetota bacterium]